MLVLAFALTGQTAYDAAQVTFSLALIHNVCLGIFISGSDRVRRRQIQKLAYNRHLNYACVKEEELLQEFYQTHTPLLAESYRPIKNKTHAAASC